MMSLFALFESSVAHNKNVYTAKI